MTSIIRYHGGKVRLADRILSLFPPHNCYVEPFGGGAAVLLAKPRSRVEIYNDLDGDMVALFRVLRDNPDGLATAIELTPFAREEFNAALSSDGPEDDLERARRVLIRSHFGHGGAGTIWRTGFSTNRRNGVLSSEVWSRLPKVVHQTAKRMTGVVIEQRPAIRVIQDHDSSQTVHYVDPPYLHETRGKHRYKYEMSREQHKDLLAALNDLDGAVILSGYASELYDNALHDWRRIEIKTHADGAEKRTEILWCNKPDALPLFGNQEVMT